MGDIMKVEKINLTLESLDIIRRLVIEYKENPAQVDTILTAVENVKDNKSLFMKGYAMNVELPMLVYNLIVLGIVRSTSLIIATCVKFISDPATNNMKKAFDKSAYKDSAGDMLYQQLVTFNEMCKNGTMTNILTAVMKKGPMPYHEDMNYDIPRFYQAIEPRVFTNPNTPDGEDINDIGAEYVPEPEDVNNPYSNPSDEDHISLRHSTDECPEVPCAPCDPGQAPCAPAPTTMEELPDDEEIFTGSETVPEPVAPNRDAVDDNPLNTPGVAPIIPECDNRTSPMEAPAESVAKTIDTDARFGKYKEDPITDKDDDDLRAGKEKYASNNVEAVKQKIITAANEGDEVAFISGIVQLNEMVELGMIDEITANDIKANAGQVIKTVKDKVGSVINKDNMNKAKEFVKNNANKAKTAIGNGMSKVGNAISKTGSNMQTNEAVTIEDYDDAELRAGKKKYASNNMEGVKQPGIDNVSEAGVFSSASNELSKLPVDDVIRGGKKFLKTGQGKAIAIAGGSLLALWAMKKGFTILIKVLIPTMRNMIYTYYYTRMKISDYFQIQAELIEMNADDLASTSDSHKTKQIVKKQRAWADRFRKWSNFFNIDKKRTETEVHKEIKNDESNKNRIASDDQDDSVLF